jgi:AraC-like DNA-binding protein
LLTSLLLTQPHNYSAEARADQRPAPPKVIQRAMKLIESRPELPLTTEGIARRVGVSVRTLQEGFQNVGGSPMPTCAMCCNGSMNSYATATRFAPPTARSSANPHPNYAADNHTGVVIGASEQQAGSSPDYCKVNQTCTRGRPVVAQAERFWLHLGRVTMCALWLA